MTVLPDRRRGQVADDLAKAVALLTAVEDVLLDSDDPQLAVVARRVATAIAVLEPVA